MRVFSVFRTMGSRTIKAIKEGRDAKHPLTSLSSAGFALTVQPCGELRCSAAGFALFEFVCGLNWKINPLSSVSDGTANS
jgi:hypothetical protein